MVRYLKLSKEDAQKLGRHLKSNNLLHPDTTFAWYRSRASSYVDFYKTRDQICFYVDIKGLLLKLSYSDNPNNWYLFMDSSQRSFKAILIEKNTLKIMPVAYSRQNKKETRDLIQQVLNKIKYDSYKWYISGDFKMIGVLPLSMEVSRQK